MKKMIVATIGGALLSGSLLGAGAASADVYYKNCTAAWDAGAAPLYEGDDATRLPASIATRTVSPAKYIPGRTPVDQPPRRAVTATLHVDHQRKAPRI